MNVYEYLMGIGIKLKIKIQIKIEGETEGLILCACRVSIFEMWSKTDWLKTNSKQGKMINDKA